MKNNNKQFVRPISTKQQLVHHQNHHSTLQTADSVNGLDQQIDRENDNELNNNGLTDQLANEQQSTDLISNKPTLTDSTASLNANLNNNNANTMGNNMNANWLPSSPSPNNQLMLKRKPLFKFRFWPFFGRK